MSKALLIEQIANNTGESKTKIAEFVDAFCSSVQNLVAKDEKVSLTGFGVFSKSHRKATTGRNPRTGEEIKISARNLPHFKAGKNFKEAVN